MKSIYICIVNDIIASDKKKGKGKKEQLQLKNQVCFPLYAVSRLVIQKYKPLLDKLGVTYPQYLVLMVLWEQDEVAIKEISEKLFLETNTLTPLLKRMQANELIERNRSKKDERIVSISLTKKGQKLQEKAMNIPEQLFCALDCMAIEKADIIQLKVILDKMLVAMTKNECEYK